MSSAANTRIFKGSILAVRNAASDDWITTGAIISTSGFGSPAPEINISTAASSIDEFTLGLQDQGDADFEFFLNMDDLFQIEMETMRNAQSSRVFTLTLPEGTLNTLTWTGFVIDSSVTAVVNNVYKMKLTLGITSAITRTHV